MSLSLRKTIPLITNTEIYCVFGGLYFYFKQTSSNVYCYTKINGVNKYWALDLYKEYLNKNYHRMFVHFNNLTGLITTGFDDNVFSQIVNPRSFPSSSVSIYISKTSHPGFIVDNIKVLKSQTFPIDDYMLQYYPEFKIAFPPNNYDFAWSPIIHADWMTTNMTIPIFDFYNSYGISVGQTYFYNNSLGVDTLADNASLRNLALSKSDKNGIYTHSFQKNTSLKTNQILGILYAWKNLMGSYPIISADHASLNHNIEDYGSVASSIYYINGLRNSSSLKYMWANYGGSEVLPTPEGYYREETNSFRSFQLGNHSVVYSNSGINNLFSSGKRIIKLDPFYSWIFYPTKLANQRGLALEHTYQSYYLYKNINGIKYTKVPETSGYVAYPSNWNLYYHDNISPWTIIPEYYPLMDNLTSYFSIYSDFAHKMT